jgi:selenocysteine lyase/cysteine desulfurase
VAGFPEWWFTITASQAAANVEENPTYFKETFLNLKRRNFLQEAGGLAMAALPAFRKGGLSRILAAGDQTAGRSAESLAADEDYWFEIQSAFNIDRSMIKLLHSPDPRQSCGIGFLRVEGLELGKLSDFLWEKHRIICDGMGHPKFSGLRVTPNVYSTIQEIDLFSAGVESAIKSGV